MFVDRLASLCSFALGRLFLGGLFDSLLCNLFFLCHCQTPPLLVYTQLASRGNIFVISLCIYPQHK
jgi:hypothetical protein